LVLGEAKKNTLPQQGAAPTAAAPERALAAPAAPNNMGLQKTAKPQNVVSPGAGDNRAMAAGLRLSLKTTAPRDRETLATMQALDTLPIAGRGLKLKKINAMLAKE